jgi:hypothetical protein
MSTASEDSHIPEELTCNICQELYCAAVSTSVCRHSFCSHCIRLDANRQLKSLKKWISCPSCRAQLFPRGISKVDKVLQPNLEIQQQVHDFKKNKDSTCSSLIDRKSSHRNPPLKPHPTIIYQGKKRKDYVQMLQKHRLPTDGSESELKTRHERFVLCWNAFCDERIDPPTAEFVKRYFVSHHKLQQQQVKSTEKLSTKQTFCREFQDLHSKIRQDFAEKWSQDNFALAIFAIQHHPLLQDSSLRDQLRNRALAMDYTSRPLLQLLQDCRNNTITTITTTFAANSTTPTDSKPTTRTSQVPPCNTGNKSWNVVSSSGNRKKQEQALPKTTMATRPSEWNTNPEARKRPLPTTTTTRAITPASPPPVSVFLATNPEARKRPLPTRASAATTPAAPPVPVVSATKKPRTAEKSKPPPSSNRNRNFSKDEDKRWHWICQICTYEMKLDRRATKCAFCGAAKGKTFDEVHSENKNQDENQAMASSSDNPIQIFY